MGELGASMTEYTVMLAGMVLVVMAGLVFLGGSLGGSFTDVVINAPLSQAGSHQERPPRPFHRAHRGL